MTDYERHRPVGSIESYSEVDVAGGGQATHESLVKSLGVSAKQKPKKNGKAKKSGARPADAKRKHKIIGSSAAIKKLREQIDLFATEEEPVLIFGETGSGKEAVAHRIHARSKRSGGPLVIHNAGRIDHELAGSEFFGHKRGAFTGAVENRDGLFALANSGTLHLDEISEMPFVVQANLLRVIEDGMFAPVGSSQHVSTDVRVIAATNKDLKVAVEHGTFREDLFHRLNVLRIDVPPLRARGDDIVEIADYFLWQRAETMGRVTALTPISADKLKAYAWPGNVRELRNVVIRAAVLCGEGEIHPDFVEIPDSEGPPVADIDTGKELVSRLIVATALEQAKGNVSEASRKIKLNRTSLHNWKKKLVESGDTRASLTTSLYEALGIDRLS